jgi:hypothetical protein
LFCSFCSVQNIWVHGLWRKFKENLKCIRFVTIWMNCSSIIWCMLFGATVPPNSSLIFLPSLCTKVAFQTHAPEIYWRRRHLYSLSPQVEHLISWTLVFSFSFIILAAHLCILLFELTFYLYQPWQRRWEECNIFHI